MALSYVLSTRFESLYTNMYHIGPSDGAVALHARVWNLWGNHQLYSCCDLQFQEHRLLLSGTPLQNNVSELFSLLNFLEPSQFNSSEAFLQEFGALKTDVEVQKLQVLLKPMMLRRLKEDVEKSIAPKEETVVEVPLSGLFRIRNVRNRNMF